MPETNETVANLFTKASHHINVSMAYLAQDLFPKKQICTHNEPKFSLHRPLQNLRDATQFANLARQMYPKRSHFAVEANKDATSEPYS